MILSSGFEAFAGFSVNSSELVIQMLRNSTSQIEFTIDTCLLPVRHQQCFEDLLPHLRKKEYSHVFLLGMAANSARIAIEKVAINWINDSVPDNASQQLLDKKIEENAPDAYFSNFPVVSLVKSCSATHIPVQISLSAGSFICNELYYRTLHWMKQNQYHAKTVFIHLPSIDSHDEQKDKIFEDIRQILTIGSRL